MRQAVFLLLFLGGSVMILSCAAVRSSPRDRTAPERTENHPTVQGSTVMPSFLYRFQFGESRCSPSKSALSASGCLFSRE